MKKIISIALTVALMITMVGGTAFATPAQTSVTVNGVKLEFAQQPINEGGMVFVPIRGILEAFGQKVVWDQKSKTAEATDAITEMWTKIDTNSPLVVTKQKGVERQYEMIAAPILINGSTLISVRAISEIFSKNVGWNDATKTVIITDCETGTLLNLKDTEYKGYLGDMVKVHVSEDGTYKWTAGKNNDFVFINKAAEGVGNYSLYFKAVSDKDASLKLEKMVGDKIGETKTYKTTIIDPADMAITLDSTKKTDVKVGDYVKVILKEQAASTGYRWYATSQPAGLQQIEKNVEAPKTDLIGAPNNIVVVFKVVNEGNMTLQYEKMRSWSSDAAEKIKFEINAVAK